MARDLNWLAARLRESEEKNIRDELKEDTFIESLR